MTDKKKVSKKPRVNRKRKVIHNYTKYLYFVLFFLFSFLFSRHFLSSINSQEKVSNIIEKKCDEELSFSIIEKEFLAISSFVAKPLNVKGEATDPCIKEYTNQIIFENKKFSEKNEQGTLVSVLNMDEEMRRMGKIFKLKNDTEEKEENAKRKKKLNSYSRQFQANYPRFEIDGYLPENALYFGIELNEIYDVEKYLNTKLCQRPAFSLANNQISHLGLFFTVNAKRSYGGRVQTTNNRYINLIEGEFNLYEYLREPFHRYIPSGRFSMWVHKDSHVVYKGYKYQRQWLSQEYRFDWDRSPWLYNSCSQSISVISNYCALDPRQDMQYKDFIYLVKQDKIIGNIYCKRSSAKSWNKVANFEFIRKK